MYNLQELVLEDSDYLIKYLTLEDAAILQALYNQCVDFALLTYGCPFSQNAAREEFIDVPEGKTKDDNYLFGLYDSYNRLIGAIASHKHYPNCQTWWIGLMMLTPASRNRGLGKKFYRAFECWVAKQNIAQISLCTVQENTIGLKFWQKMGFKIVRTISTKQFQSKNHKVYVLNKKI